MDHLTYLLDHVLVTQVDTIYITNPVITWSFICAVRHVHRASCCYIYIYTKNLNLTHYERDKLQRKKSEKKPKKNSQYFWDTQPCLFLFSSTLISVCVYCMYVRKILLSISQKWWSSPSKYCIYKSVIMFFVIFYNTLYSIWNK